MEDRHLLLIKDRDVFRAIILDSEVANEILSRDVVRLFGKNFAEQDTFCEWFAITAKEDGDFVGVSFADFYISKTAAAVRGLESKTTVASENGLSVLLREVSSWEVQQWPYLPVHFLREKGGDYCYLLPSAFGPSDELPQGFRHASSLEELAEPAVPHKG